MESHFPRCVHCVSTLSIGGGVIGTIKAFLKKEVTCAACGKSMQSADAQVMGETFAAAVKSLHDALKQELARAPVLTTAQAQRALGAEMGTAPVHKIHGDEELSCAVVKIFRMALRHEAVGNEGVITISLIAGPANAQITKIHAPGLHKEVLPTTLLVAKISPQDFLVLQRGGQAVPPKMAAHPILRHGHDNHPGTNVAPA
ncbi:MAG: hypothetical protein HKL95_11270 [Phycisphaerae bacterium]|nr:hypothetical protein [Phycisphaerae bacterium]